jgi:hypothetical protein
VADIYRYVVGVDTHAATHSYAIVGAPNGALIDHLRSRTFYAAFGIGIPFRSCRVREASSNDRCHL